MSATTCTLTATGQLTEPAQVRTALDPQGHPHPVLCATLRTATGQCIKVRQDYPPLCHDQAERDAKRWPAGAHASISYELHHAHLCADHAVLQHTPAPATEPNPQQEIFA
jgi:hypothetical protein